MRNALILSFSAFALLAVSLSTLAGCELRSSIPSATARQSGDAMHIEVEIPSRDATKIKSREIYFSIVVFSCNGNRDGFPVEPYIDGQRASEFQFSTEEKVIEVSGSMPVSIFDKFDHPCAFLRGGGYLTGTLLSEPVPITRKPASEIN